MKNCSNNQDLKSIQNIYQNVAIGLYQQKFLGTVNVFTLVFDNIQTLSENWRDLYSSIAAYFQAGLPQNADFERWNIYLIYISRVEVDKGLQYKIENDRFASRKIVIGNFKEEITDAGVEKLIQMHITNTDLEVDIDPPKPADSFLKNSLIATALSKVKATTSKKKNDEDIQNILKDLENKLV